MPTTPRPPPAHPRRPWWWLAAGWLALGGLLASMLWIERLKVETRERQRLAHQAGIVHDNLAGQLKAVYAVLSRLVEEPRAGPLDRLARRAANARLRAFSEALSGVRTISVLDARGTVVASDREALIGQNFAYRDYFRAAQAAGSPDTLVVGAPFKAVLDGGWYMTLARIVPDADGGFGGVAMATLDPREFHTLLDSVRYAPDMVAGLVHADGLRFALLSSVPQPPGVDVAQAGTLFARHRASGARASVLRGPMQPGAAPSLMAVRDIAPPELHMDKPLVAGAARDWDAVFEGWRTAAGLAATLYLLLGAAAAMALGLVQGRRREVRAHAQALAQKEQALEALWRTVLEATAHGVWDWRSDSGQAYFSPGWKALLGCAGIESGDALAEWRARVHPDDLPRVREDVRRHLKGLAPVYDNTHRLRHQDGHYIWLQGRGRVVERDARGRALRFIGTYGDVTEQRQQQLRLDRLAESVPGMLYQYQQDAGGHAHFPYASAGTHAIYGYPPEALRADASPVFARIHPDDAPRVLAGIAQSAQALAEWRAEYRVLLPGRGERWVSGQAQPQRLDSGATLWHGYLHDVTEAKQQALQLQETERLLQHLMNEMPIGLCMVDEAGRLYFRNRRFIDYFGWGEDELATLEQWWTRVYPDPQYRAQVQATWSQAMQQARGSGGDIAPHEYRTRARDGTERTVAIGGLVFGGHFLATFVDRTEQQAQSELLRQLAYIDSLTGVANRRHFDQTLAAEWRRCRRSRQPLALVMIDIDHFKQFNDLYGHQAGDACMRAVATTLRGALARSHDLVARYGGEEFVCLLPKCDLAGASAKAEALRQAVQALAIGHRGAGGAGVVTVSVGVAAQVPDGEHTPESLLARADAHLYRAKAGGRNRVDHGTDSLPV